MVRVTAPLVVLILFTTGLAGCLQADTPPSAVTEGAEADAALRAHVVVALIDSGINAYHVAFRDDSPEAFTHPSTYLDGYPADAIALNLTFDAPDWETAVRQDCDVWNGLEADRLYWVPGTRIVGILFDEVWASIAGEVDCGAGELPLRGLDTLAPHGSGAAGRAAGAETSLCPECKVVMTTHSGQTTHAMKWAADQPWIDVQSNSWGGYACHSVDQTRTVCDRGPRESAMDATAKQVTFSASGNGVRSGSVAGFGAAAGVGVPTYLKPAQGHPGVIVVGGHDNGEFALWPGTLPHVVADAAAHPSAAWDALEGGSFGGTSGSTPFAAGAFAGMLLEARRLVGDTGTGLREGDLVVASPSADLPASGPLADGHLTREEAERLFMRAADARPAEDLPFDGEIACSAADTCVHQWGYMSYVPWSLVPEGVPAYYFVGYGQVGTTSLARTLEVLRGESEAPERPMADRFFEADAAVRETLHG